jgi:hypothetical protein
MDRGFKQKIGEKMGMRIENPVGDAFLYKPGRM